MKTIRLAATALCAALMLAACDKTPDASSGGKPAAEAASQPVSLAAIQADAKGFTVGSAMSVRTVYVFFDSQCPHCAELWQTAKPLKSQTKFVWVPIRLLNDTSEGQGAAILAAKDPAAAMDEHEASMAARTGGISAMGDLGAQRAIVKKNTELFNRFGFASVPSIVGTQAQSGAMVVHEGALPTAELAKMLGLAVPSGQ
ncbi:MAG: thioredoxin fold domain-containing protein [Ramlibacter sp.]